MRNGVTLVVWALVWAGCDKLWGVQAVAVTDATIDVLDTAPDACVAIGHDEDGDGLDDACDPCPFSANHADDSDGDGIPLACDPDPSAANVRLFFTGFDLKSRAALTSIGAGNYVGDTFLTSGSGNASLVWQGPVDRAVWLLAGVDILSVNGAASFRELGVIYDAATSPSPTELNGTMCVWGTNQQPSEYLQVYLRARPAGDTPIATTTPPVLVQVNFKGVIRGASDRSGNPAAGCWFAMGATESGISATPAPPPPSSGKLALYGSNLDASFRFLFVVGSP
jgi:hypothetical protein